MKLNYSSKILILSAILFVGILALNVATMNLLLKEIDSVNYKIKQLEETAREIEKGLSLKDSLASSQLERERLTEYFLRPFRSIKLPVPPPIVTMFFI